MLRLTLFTLLLLAPVLCQGAGTVLKPPCGEPPIPPYPQAGQPPVADVWSESELRRAGWTAPECLDWRPGRTRQGASAVAPGSDASYVNRLAALYRYIAGVPADLKPPAL